MTDPEADLKATAEDLAADAVRLHEIELQKVSLKGDDPRVAELSAQAERLTAGMAHKARVESALAREATK